MTFERLSKKQKLIFRWAHSKRYGEYNALICDGAVRSGKTSCMAISFVHWAMRNFESGNFGICGRSVMAAERNIVSILTESADIRGFYNVSYVSSKRMLVVKSGRCENRFYLFGGRDESSYASIQGITLCGVLLDEVALMPRSFVEQAIARTLSVSGAKLWFNCNPSHPEHWFYKEWIVDANGENRKKSLYLHFKMEDNPALTKEQIEKAGRLYSGVFKDRYVHGLWTVAQGLVYPMFDSSRHIVSALPTASEYYISVDYGTANPCSMGLWARVGDGAVRVAEFYYDSAKSGQQLTDEEYYRALVRLAGGRSIKAVIVDPTASSFIACVRRHGEFCVRRADNSVIDGIRFVCELLKSGRLHFSEDCRDILREFSLYRWDETSSADAVYKEFDHAMDDMRYFCSTVLRHRAGKAQITPGGAVMAGGWDV